MDSVWFRLEVVGVVLTGVFLIGAAMRSETSWQWRVVWRALMGLTLWGTWIGTKAILAQLGG